MNNIFFESICIKNKLPLHLELHQERLDQTYRRFFNSNPNFQLKNLIDLYKILDNDFWKCRIIYDRQIINIEYEKYQLKNPKKIKLIESPDFQYDAKYYDRSFFNSLLNENKDYDEIIICKNDLLTDTTYSNLAFFDGRDWFTPKQYLLNGVKRKYLLQQGIIHETDISINNLQFFQKISFLNAMRGLSVSYEFEFSRKDHSILIQ